MTRAQSDEAYKDWVDLRKAEDALKAEIAEHEQASRWQEFQRNERYIDQRTTHQGIAMQMLLKIVVILLALFLFGIALRFH